MDPVSVAAGAVTALVPYLAEAGKAAAGEVGKSTWAGATKLWTLLRGKLRRPEQQAALTRLELQPGDPDVQAAARVEVREALKKDADLLAELAALLQSLPEPVRQTQVINGNDINAVQAVGSTVHIGGR